MKIEFRRSGGFSPMTNASGTVEFSDKGAEIVSANGQYRRTLSPEEAEKLRSAAAPIEEAAAGSGQTGSSPVRDGFQYDITVVDNDGKQRKLTLGSNSNAQGITKNPDALAGFVQEESQKILANRAAGG